MADLLPKMLSVPANRAATAPLRRSTIFAVILLVTIGVVDCRSTVSDPGSVFGLLANSTVIEPDACAAGGTPNRRAPPATAAATAAVARQRLNIAIESPVGWRLTLHPAECRNGHFLRKGSSPQRG